MRLAHSYKTFALCKLSRWEEAKSNSENVVYQFEKNSSAACRLDILISHQNSIECDKSSFVHVMSLMGPALARNYMSAIKNVNAFRNVLAIESAIDSTLQVLKGLGMLMSASVDWSWVAHALQSTERLYNIVIKANEKFRSGEFQESIILYSEAIKIDPEACLWNAILYCNRAAAYMNLGKYNDAINDCHHSLERDPNYQKAILRRARSYKVIVFIFTMVS
jgi:tetratricopeptide (TPR) repeat protein